MWKWHLQNHQYWQYLSLQLCYLSVSTFNFTVDGFACPGLIITASQWNWLKIFELWSKMAVYRLILWSMELHYWVIIQSNDRIIDGIISNIDFGSEWSFFEFQICGSILFFLIKYIFCPRPSMNLFCRLNRWLSSNCTFIGVPCAK